jgi:putative endonuclease
VHTMMPASLISNLRWLLDAGLWAGMTFGGCVQGSYFVYILASRIGGTLYIGVTSDLLRRVHEHKAKVIQGFTSRYNVTRLVYYEELGDIRAAIAREKYLKNWTRAQKISLIEEHNPNWDDLAADWYPRTS